MTIAIVQSVNTFFFIFSCRNCKYNPSGPFTNYRQSDRDDERRNHGGGLAQGRRCSFPTTNQSAAVKKTKFHVHIGGRTRSSVPIFFSVTLRRRGPGLPHAQSSGAQFIPF